MRFKKIYIEITNQCNLNCSFCIKNSRPLKNISLDEFQYILTQIKPYTKYIYLHVLGEPLLHPQLEKLLQIASDNDFYVNITTNGTLLEKCLDILLKSKALRQINVSLHSFPHQSLYLKKVVECGDLLSQNGVYVSYRLWTISSKLDTNSQTTIEYLEKHYNKTISEYKDSFKLKDRCFISFDSQFEWPNMEHDFISEVGFCHGFKNMCAILVDGSVVPCCLDSKGDGVLGNIYRESFDSILKRNEYILENLRKHILTLDICKKCSYRTRFDK